MRMAIAVSSFIFKKIEAMILQHYAVPLKVKRNFNCDLFTLNLQRL